MNRRDVVRRLIGAPLALAGVRAVTLSAPVVLAARAIHVDMSLVDQGDGLTFRLTLLQKPWPSVGDRVEFDHQSLHLAGRVTRVATESVGGTDRCFYHVDGRVLEFQALAVTD